MAKNPTTPTTIPMINGRLVFDSSTAGAGDPGVPGVVGVAGVTPGVQGVAEGVPGGTGVPGAMIGGGAPGAIYLSTTP